MGGTLFVQRNVLCGCREVKACLGIPGSDAGGTRGAARGCCLMVGLERRGEYAWSETRAGILRLGAALAGKADAGPGAACVLRSLSGMSGGWDGPVWSSPRAARFGQAVARRTQKSLPCGGLCHSRWRTGFRDCPREGARSCLALGGHAVPSEKMAGKGSALGRGLSSHAGEAPSVDVRLWPVLGLGRSGGRSFFLAGGVTAAGVVDVSIPRLLPLLRDSLPYFTMDGEYWEVLSLHLNGESVK